MTRPPARNTEHKNMTRQAKSLFLGTIAIFRSLDRVREKCCTDDRASAPGQTRARNLLAIGRSGAPITSSAEKRGKIVWAAMWHHTNLASTSSLFRANGLHRLSVNCSERKMPVI